MSFDLAVGGAARYPHHPGVLGLPHRVVVVVEPHGERRPYQEHRLLDGRESRPEHSQGATGGRVRQPPVASADEVFRGRRSLVVLPGQPRRHGDAIGDGQVHEHPETLVEGEKTPFGRAFCELLGSHCHEPDVGQVVLEHLPHVVRVVRGDLPPPALVLAPLHQRGVDGELRVEVEVVPADHQLGGAGQHHGEGRRGEHVEGLPVHDVQAEEQQERGVHGLGELVHLERKEVYYERTVG